MLQRCGLRAGWTASDQKYYIEKGIGVCVEWVASYKAFEEWALANGYKPELQLDRKDNKAGYWPENCRWITPAQNQRNKGNTIRLANGMALADYYDKYKSESSPLYRVFRQRLYIGWDLCSALHTPAYPRVGRPKKAALQQEV